MDSFTTTYLYDIISKCTQSELHQISLQQVKAAYGSIGLKPGSKRKEELIQDIIAYLTSILIKQCNGNQIREGFPLFNHNNELFQRNPHVKNLIEACNQQIHITNIQLAQLNYTRMNQAKRIITPPTNIYRCYCDQTIDPSYITDHVIKCINPKCGKLLHRFCMKLKNERDTYPLFECPECVLSKCDPLHQVLKVLVQPYVVDNRRRDFIIDDALYREVKMNESLAIEVRCIKLEDKSHEQCWPHNGELVLNQFKYLEFKPLQQNSSLKKRKDEKFVSTEVNCGNNSLWLKFVRGSDPRNPRAEETYIAAVYLVRRLTCDELARKIKAENKRPVEECKKKIIDDFETSSVDIDKLVYPMTCVFDMQPLKTPAKGAHCKHSNCFSLENFINVWQKNNQRKWNCPICKLKTYDIIVDGYWEKILDDLKKSGHDNPSQVEVEIMRNAEYKFVKTEDDTDSEDEQKVEAKPEKVQPEKAMNLIVLDDSDEEGGKRKAAGEASAKATEAQSKMIIENEHKGHEKKKPDGAMQEEKEATHISEQDQVLAKLKSNPVPSGLKDDKGLTEDQKKRLPIQINSNEVTPQKAHPETEPKVIKHAPLPTDKEQAKSLEQKHREALQNKAQPMGAVPGNFQHYEQTLAALARQQQQQHQQQQQQRQQQERNKMPFAPNPQSHMQHMATPQRQASQEKHQPQLQPQQQGPKQPPKPNDPAANLLNMNMQQNAALAKLMGAFRGPGGPNMTPQAMSALLPFLNMNANAKSKMQAMGGAGGRPFEELNALLLQDTPYKYGNPELNALLMRSLDMAYRVNPNLLPQPNADLNMNILGMMNRPPLAGNGTTIHNSPNPNIQNQGTFLKESLTPKHPGSRIEGDNSNTLAPAENTKTVPPERDRMFEETEKHIEKMVDLAEYRVDLPTYETFKTKKNPEPKKMKETDYQKNKKLVSFIMKQLPLQSKGMTNNSLKLNNGPEAAGTTNINPMGNMQVETKTTGGMKIQGKEYDPICLD